MPLRKCALTFAILIGLVLAPSLSGQSVPPDFEKAKNERNTAMRSGNFKIYSLYTTDNFMVVMPDGSMQSKADRMAIMAKAEHPEILGETRDEKAIVAGDTIIVNWISAIQGKDARFTEVWIKRGGSWKVAAAHVSMMQKKN